MIMNGDEWRPPVPDDFWGASGTDFPSASSLVRKGTMGNRSNDYRDEEMHKYLDEAHNRYDAYPYRCYRSTEAAGTGTFEGRQSTISRVENLFKYHLCSCAEKSRSKRNRNFQHPMDDGYGLPPFCQINLTLSAALSISSGLFLRR